MVKNIELSDLNHRMLIEKAREDFRALEKNMDVLYICGASQTVRYTDAIVRIVESIEKLSEGAYGQANHQIIMDNQIKIEPMKPTSADEILCDMKIIECIHN